MEDREKIKYQKMAYLIWSLIGLLLLFLSIVYFFNLLKPILTPFVIAVALVYLFRPGVIFLEKRGLPRILSIILVYLSFFVLLSLLFVYFVPLIASQLYELGRNFPAYFNRVSREISYFQARYSKLEFPSWFDKALSQAVDSFRDFLVRFASSLPSLGVNVVSSFFTNIFYFILSFVLGFFLLKDYEAIKETLYELLPLNWRPEGKALLSRVSAVVRGFIIGQALVSLSVGVLTTLALLILGVDYALLIGLVSGVLNVIPYFGPLAGAILAGLVALFKSPWLALWAVVAMLVVQQLDSLFISPNIMSYQVRLHPVLIVFSLLSGGLFWGAMGMLLSIPLAAALKAVVYYFLEERGQIKAETRVRKSGKPRNKRKIS